jgi:hypothetical protein
MTISPKNDYWRLTEFITWLQDGYLSHAFYSTQKRTVQLKRQMGAQIRHKSSGQGKRTIFLSIQVKRGAVLFAGQMLLSV